ncbi:MAG: phosphatase PAP2 family protein [Saprospiraceae bacterium]|nr:phosphatase PAP2 family protein [Saprospiraceae bacterium]
MVKTVNENRFYFVLLAVFVLVGGIYLSQSNKADAIYYFSENRTTFLNGAFIFINYLGEAYVYFLIGIAALAVRVRYSLMVAITGLSVMATSFGLKTLFAIDRPSAFFAKQNLMEKISLIDGIELHNGATSFPSGHTMSAFALYTLLILLLPSKKRYALLLFTIAFLVGVSRIYLVQHFPPDVYAGGIIGAALAMAIYSVQSRLEANPEGWLDKPLFRVS